MYQSEAASWAHETFSRADLGDPRRTRRLISIASAVARCPSGTVTGTNQDAAGTEGTFRFLENDRVRPDEVAKAVFESAALACANEDHVFVPMDQTDLTFVDRTGCRGLGPNPSRLAGKLRGLQVMSALALDSQGVVIGLLDQQWWKRSEAKAPRGKKDKRTPEERESWEWVRCIEAATERLHRMAPNARPWFQMDRGADFWGVLEAAVRLDVDVTVRAVHQRVIRQGKRRAQLWNTVARAPIQGHLEIWIPPAHGRVSRLARFEVRAGTYRVRMRAKEKVWSTLGCLRIREVGTIPCGEERIEWKLMTTVAINDEEDARQVVAGYVSRWRIEEFHKTWKSGCCDVEASQLRSFDALVRWGTILAAVATRVERLKLVARAYPDRDALSEFTQDEIDAAIILTKTKKHRIGDKITLSEAVRLVAMAGGFMGRKGDGNPGSITIKRGMDRVLPAAQALLEVRTCG